MGDTPRGIMPLIAPNCMSLGSLRTNPYNLGTHSECHQQYVAIDSSRYSVKSNYALIPISYIALSNPSASFHDLGEVGHI